MRESIFKISSTLVKVIKYISFMGAFLISLGTILTFFYKNTIIEMIQSGDIVPIGTYNITFSIILYACVIGLLISLTFGVSLNNFEKILKNFEDREYFKEENSRYTRNILISIAVLTLVEMVSALVFHSINTDNVSLVFDLSIKDYFVNGILMLIAFGAMILFHKGKELKDDSESIV